MTSSTTATEASAIVVACSSIMVIVNYVFQLHGWAALPDPVDGAVVALMTISVHAITSIARYVLRDKVAAP